jgi:hypothetical protein
MNYIDSNTADSLIISKGGKIDSALSEKYGLKIYLLNDHSVISVEYDTFVEFADINELDTFLSKYRPIVHILYDKNPFNRDFPLHTHNLIKSLLDYLDVPEEIRKIDKTLIQFVNDQFVERESFEELRERFLLNIIALVGEIFIIERNAKWEMTLSDDGVTWSPQLNYKGHEIALSVYVFEALFDHPSVKDEPITFSYDTIKDIIDASIEKFSIPSSTHYRMNSN